MSIEKSRVVFIFPTVILGGHEIMALRIVNALVEDGCEVICYVSKYNHGVISFLKGCQVVLMDYKVGRLDILTNLFNLKRVLVVRDVLKRIKSQGGRAVIVQGMIEFGFDFLYMSRLMGLILTSYLPMCHSAKKVRARLYFIRDLIGMVLYRLPSRYIVISDSIRNELIKINKKSNVFVVKNYIDRTYFCDGFSDTGKINILSVGRVYFPHKSQDLLISALGKLPRDLLEKLTVHIVGDGPDLERLKVISKEFPVTFHGWSSNWLALPIRKDFLFISSGFEGVPLVMLEAISASISVVAPARDGMVDYIDSDYLYNDLYPESDEPEIIRFLVMIASGILLPVPQYKVNPEDVFLKSDLSVFLG